MNVLASALSEAMTASPNALAVLDTDTHAWQRHPWAEVHSRAENVADRIADDGAGAVGLVGEPNVEFLAAIPGTFFAGSALSILPSPVRGADADAWARNTIARFRALGVTTVFSHGPQLDLLRDRDEAIVVHDVARVAHDRRSTTFRGADSGDVAILQGTAGSTGTPKAARISPAAALANYGGLMRHVDVDHRSRAHSWLPIYHDMGLAFVLTSALAGAELWQAPTAAFAGNPFGWLTWLTESRATMTAAPNMAYNVIGKYAKIVGDDVDLSHVGFALNGGEPVDCDGTRRFATEMARFGFDPKALAASYGLAESTCAVTVPRPFSGLDVDEPAVRADGGEATRRFAVLGDAIPGMEVRIDLDSARDTEVLGREVGDVEVRGTSLMTGYVGEAPVDPTAWLPTGDVGYLVDGRLVVCGRAKELITVAGRNVFPTEIERIAARVDGVREGAVVAIGTGESTARPGLLIAAEFKGTDQPSARSEVVALIASECGVVPADVVFLEPGTLPRTSSGKLRRLEVKRNLEEIRR
ncbi:long-chain-fatty acid--ACP ligase MbtM [Mycolicibacterium sediminis]|uniref:Long-chain-fatty-acid--ACP ligase n=1 Tax=Mycolicibacterium sediminis TaxID=1286180 RepID=A0A7I7QSI3_9MYCO|nr:long-chain-fatty acid--ACP ligase MbtM [Mycolicibacterium sediminis]BBY28927.1 long-chain-fatty-acid--ACP ligase [Mycolicibacterium sediminis]